MGEKRERERTGEEQRAAWNGLQKDRLRTEGADGRWQGPAAPSDAGSGQEEYRKDEGREGARRL